MWLFFHYNIQHIFTFLQHEAKHHSKVKEIIISLSKKLLWYYGLFPSTIQLKKQKQKNRKKKTMPILWKRQLHEQAANHWLVAIYGRKLLQWANSRLYMSQTPIMKKSRCGWRLLHNGSNPWFWFCGYYCSWLKIN